MDNNKAAKVIGRRATSSWGRLKGVTQKRPAAKAIRRAGKRAIKEF